MNRLTEEQFQVAEDKITSLARKARRGTEDEKAVAKTIVEEWEAAYALPFVKFVDREKRYEAIYNIAMNHGLM